MIAVVLLLIILGGWYWLYNTKSDSNEAGSSTEMGQEKQGHDDDETTENNQKTVGKEGDEKMDLLNHGDSYVSDNSDGAAVLSVVTSPKVRAYLVADNGMTLYLYTLDESGESDCYGECMKVWPPYIVESKGFLSIVGPQIDEGAVGFLVRKNGETQVTYGGNPLYFYIRDDRPGDVTGQGAGDVWYVLEP